jgi:D-amino-acid dehydrogenase
MKVVILGAGITGITTAYMLAKMGCEVVVVEKNKASGMECSHANGGQLSFSHAEPWSSKSSTLSILKAAIKPNSFVCIKDLKNKEFLKWSLRFVSNSRKKKVEDISTKLLNVGSYSRSILEDIIKQEKIDFCYNGKGILHFYRSKKLLNKAIAQAEFQKKQGCKLEILNAEECIKKEPTLTKLLDDNKLAGGILFKDDASGDPFLFMNALEWICTNRLKVEFVHDCQVKNILTNYKKVTGVNTTKGVFQGDAYVNTLGGYANALLKGININTGIYPIKGYSLSIPADKNFLAPRMALTDSENKIVYSRLGSTFRAAGTIEACNLKLNHNQKNINFLKNTIKSTYSDFGDMTNAKDWFGFRPYRPDCLPMVGKVEKYGNLFINSGHGSLGWTNSFASAKIISDKIFKRTIDSKFSFFEEKINQIL